MKIEKINFIAEISSNHNKSLNRTLKLIKSAKDSGFTSVKFQLFKINQLFSKEILASSFQHRSRAKWELPINFIPKISQYCKKINIKFGCTPFYLGAVKELAPYVDFFKISSYELLWNELLIECAKTKKPLIISTGMANLKEVKRAVKLLNANKVKDLVVMHCVSSYPAKIIDTNLSTIATLKKNLNTKIGWSDHTVNQNVIYRAIYRWEVKDVEIHYDLDGKGFEFSSGHCWLPGQAKDLIKNVNEGLVADGKNKKNPSRSELSDRNWRADPKDGLRPLKKIRNKWKIKKF